VLEKQYVTCAAALKKILENSLLIYCYTANNFGFMYSRNRIGQYSFPNFIYIFPKAFMKFGQELQDFKRNYENQI
jgi:hypothetical protein